MIKKIRGMLLAVFIMAWGHGQAQEIIQSAARPLQFDIAAGTGAFYIPAMGARYDRPDFVSYAGIQQAFSNKQLLAVGLRLGYARGNYQGDALQLQALFHLTPTIARHIELGLALGGGYQLSFYPSQSLRWTEGGWEKGTSSKGMFQLPLQLSVGYRSIKVGGYDVRPYLAYQAKVLLGYSPSLSPLPVSDALLGLKISSLKK